MCHHFLASQLEMLGPTGDAATSDDVALAYAQLATHFAAHEGVTAVMPVLQAAVRHLPLPNGVRLRRAVLQVAHQAALHTEHLAASEIAAAELAALTQPLPEVLSLHTRTIATWRTGAPAGDLCPGT
eukprot:gene4128-5105_t